MRLKNKRTGEIGELQVTEKHCAVAVGNGTASCGLKIYSSLARLYEEWEDVPEEPKEWYINENNEPQQVSFGDPIDDIENLRELGLLFETREEAEKAVEKLKAWKRLGDKGFRFTGYDTNCGHHRASFVFEKEAWATETEPDLDLLFGGEE